MKYLKLHPWNVSYEKAVEIQEELEKSIILKIPVDNINLIAGADVSYLPENPSRLPARNRTWEGKKRVICFLQA